MTSTSRVPELWEAAFVRCRACLQSKDAAQILQVTTYDQLLESLSKHQQEHKKRVISRALNRLEPFLLNLKSLSAIIDTFVSAKPDIAALIWGGIKLTLELALRVRGAIEKVVPGMSYVAQVTPRFEAYTSILPNAPRLAEALIQAYEAIVLFHVDSIKFLRTGSIKILFKSLGRDFSGILRDAQVRIEQRSRLVDIEAYAANMGLDQERHEEIKKLVEHIPTNPSKSVNLPCYIIPYLQNLNFFGRDRELKLCRSVLNDPATTTSSRCLSLHGIAGVGKTSIALSLAYEAKAHKTIVIWFTADSKEKLDKTYSRVAHELGLHEDNASTDQDRDAVRVWLENTDRPWLMVFDNVDDASLLDEYVPAGSSGSVLITSRDPESQHGLAKQGCKVGSFDKTEGRDFILNLLPGVDVNDKAYVDKVSEITDQLGGLPLGLKQVAGFLRESGIDISELSELLNDTEQNAQIFADTSGFAKLGYGHTLSTVWTMSLSKLDSETLNILGLLSFLDPDGIPEIIMKSVQKSRVELPTLFPSGPNTVGHFRSISLLVRYGLVDSNQTTKSMSVHRLIQSSTLHAMPNADRNTLFDAIISVIRKDHPQSQATSDTLFKSWETCAVYAPHVLRLQVLQKQWKLQTQYPDQLWEIFFNCSWYLVETGSMKSAQSLAEHAESLCDPTTEKGQVQLSYLHNTYGVVRLQHRNLESAENWFRKVYDIRKKYLGETDINTVAVMLNFILVLLDQKRYHDAIGDLKPLRNLLPTMPDLPPRMASGVYDFLSIACFQLGRLDEAWEHIQQSIEMTRETVPPYSQGSGYYYFLQGNIRIGQGNLPDALRLHSMGLKVRKKVLGNHIQTAAACYRTGDLMDRTGEPGDAIDLLIESKRIYRALGLKEDFCRPGEARSAWRISSIMAKLGRQDEAASYANEAAKLREALGFDTKENLEQRDFDELISGLEQ